MTEQMVSTVLWTVLGVTAIQATALYCVVRLVVTGRPIFERRRDEEPGRVIGMGR